MKDYLEVYRKQEEGRLKQAKKELREVCGILEPLGITRIEAEYDGSGDSGAIETVTFFSKGHEYKGDLPKEKFKSLFDYSEEKRRGVDITEIINEICCYFLPDGWEINDGAYGVLKIDVKKKTVNLEHNQRYTEVTFSEENFKL